ncbi:MAG: FtsQ-type POTRA domain-containing protein [Opitutaceae bacterium]
MNPRDTPTPARNWRDIPQQMSPRTMSSEGRKRVIYRVLKMVAVVGAVGALGWGGLEIASTFKENPRKAPDTALQSAPVKDLLLVTDGVLDQTWMNRTLALPKKTSLMELDLFQLRTRVLASGQVRAATITRNFPSTLAVSLSERMPVARLSAQNKDDAPRTLLVARDGVVYEGVGYDAAMIETLPWLGGVKLTRAGGTFQPIAGMESVAELLAKAKMEAEHLYNTWKVVSLAKLNSDDELEVTTKDATKITFSITEDFFRQLANLDAILDAAAAHPEKSLREINLAVGSQVPVSFHDAAPAITAAPVSRSAPPAAVKSLVLPSFSTH